MNSPEDIPGIDELRSQLRDAQQAHRIVAKRLAEYERSKSARMIRGAWNVERQVRDVAIKWRLRYRGVRRRLGGNRAQDTPAPAGRSSDKPPEPVHLEVATEPTVSIVIPIHGQLDTTAACLQSIASAATDVAYEVVVVDDASPDHSAAWLAECSGIKVLSIDDNIGYLRATNRGAAAVSGQFVCLLNNDTEVHDRWLDELIATFDSHEDVGAVGAKLLYPNGEVQEAGAIIWSDGRGHNMGRGGPPDDPAISFVREVDYCSAACLVIPTEVWNELGGFDERYVPAYYEDTDLAFRLRASGRRVLYQPGAVVTHHEGVSHGTDTSAGGKTHQLANRDRFVERWKRELAQQPRRRSCVDLASWRGEDLVVIADHRLPSPDIESASVRMMEILDELRRRQHRVILLPADGQRREPYATHLEQLGVRLAISRTEQSSVINGCAASAALVVLSRPDVGALYLHRFRSGATGVPIAYDMVDFHALRIERESAEGGTTVAVDPKLADELIMFDKADIVVAITDAEASIVSQRHPDKAVVVLPNIHQAKRSTAPFESRSGVLFVGSFLHSPNRDGLLWLADQIMPLVWKHRPDITLHVVGSNLPDGFLATKGRKIEVHGWLPYLDAIFEQVRLSVAPLRYGAGLKGKVGDSLARGVPVVTTPIGAEGFGSVVEALAVGTGADELASLIIGLHDDGPGWHERADRGVALVEQHLGARAGSQAVDRLLAAAEHVGESEQPS